MANGTIKPLMGSVYTVMTRDVTDTNMSPVYTMPETPLNTRPTVMVTQSIPGVTRTVPTPTDPTVQTITPTTLADTTVAVPWYQWFKDHPLYTGLIVLGVGGGIYLLTKKSKRKRK